MKIVLTGKMTRTRDKMYKQFSDYGITVMKAVSGKIDYLVTGDRPGGNKLYEAKMKKVEVITEDEFFNMLMDTHPEMLL